MFASLKNKIKEETGSDVSVVTSRLTSDRRSRQGSSSNSSTFDDLSYKEQEKNVEIAALRTQYNELLARYEDLSMRFEASEVERARLESTNDLLEESVRVAQSQKELICDEQDKIQNIQSQEIAKLKSMLLFREQEAIDRLSQIKQNQQLIDNYKNEIDRLKDLQPLLEDAQDELEQIKHSSQLERNSLTTTLAATNEENRHLKSRIEVLEQSRLSLTANPDEKMRMLLQERKLLEQRLEEAHLHLSDIKSTWSAQNLSLEIQLSRLSHQVAEETSEKRKTIKQKDELAEKLKSVQFELEKKLEEFEQRDNKVIKILEEEIDDLSSALRETRLDSEEEIMFLRTKFVSN